MTPVTSSGSSQGTMTRERPSVLPGNRRVNSNARAKPIMNWPTSDPNVNSKVLRMACRLVGSLNTKR